MEAITKYDPVRYRALMEFFGFTGGTRKAKPKPKPKARKCKCAKPRKQGAKSKKAAKPTKKKAKKAAPKKAKSKSKGKRQGSKQKRTRAPSAPRKSLASSEPVHVASAPKQLPAPERRRRVAPAKKAAKPRSGARCDVRDVAATVDALSRDPLAIPQPIAAKGCKPRKCAADAPVWGAKYQAAVAEATERAAIEAGDDETAFRKALRRELQRHPEWGKWEAIDRECLAQFRAGHFQKRRTETASRATRRATKGLEIGSAEHLDSLTPGGRAAYFRRLAKRTNSKSALSKARAIEKDMRARKKRGAGPKGHHA